MEIRTQFTEHARVISHPGSRVKPVYQPVYDDNGVLDLEQVGQEDLYGAIQSHRDSVDLKKILEHFALGDSDALNRVQGFYGDFTGMPKTYAEALNTMIQAENTFYSLPVETRAKFDHSFSQFLAQVGTPQWLKAMNITADAVVPTAPSEAAPAAGAQAAPATVSDNQEGGTSK